VGGGIDGGNFKAYLPLQLEGMRKSNLKCSNLLSKILRRHLKSC
jgi:hypothetical protein